MADIIHFTTVHSRTDTRISVKQVSTLATRLGESVSLFVQDGLGDEIDDRYGFAVHDTGRRPLGRLSRMVFGGWRMYRAVRQANPKIAHFHDPELIPFAVMLRFSGIKVIYDAHEDIELQVLHKPYLPSWAKIPLSWILARIEGLAMRCFDGTVAVLESVLEKRAGQNKVVVTNFPILPEFNFQTYNKDAKSEKRFVYAGGLTKVRGIIEMVDSMAYVKSPAARLILMGRFDDEQLEADARARAGWQNVDFIGWSSNQAVLSELARSRAGVVVLHPTPQYVAWYPVKLFEYMAAGLPVIASNFPLWVDLFRKFNCGINVDPLNPEIIADAMDWILENPKEAEAMGQRGRAAVEEYFNWDTQAQTLVDLYRKLLTHG